MTGYGKEGLKGESDSSFLFGKYIKVGNSKETLA